MTAYQEFRIIILIWINRLSDVPGRAAGNDSCVAFSNKGGELVTCEM